LRPSHMRGLSPVINGSAATGADFLQASPA
jgi:hypothetical protein